MGRLRVWRDFEEELDAREAKEVLDGLRVKRERKDVDDWERGAAAGMTTPDLRIDDLENFGAFAAKSGMGSEADGAGMGTESVHRPLSLAAAVG